MRYIMIIRLLNMPCSHLLLTVAVLILSLTACTAGLTSNPGKAPDSIQQPGPSAAKEDISDIQATGITSSSAVITWTANKPLSGLIQWGKTADYEQDKEVSGQPGVQQSVMLTGLKPGTTYHFRFNLTAQNGQPVTSKDHTFTTLEQLSESTLTVSGIRLSRISSTAASITWDTDQPATGRVEYGKTTAYGSLTAVNSSYALEHTVEIGNLLPKTTYHYRVISQNKGGSESVSTDHSFTTADPSDKTAPVISDIEVIDITNQSATIRWVTSELATGQIEYSADFAPVNIIPSDGTMGYNHIATIENLDNSKTYHFKVSATDWAGNTSVSADHTFVTDSGPRILGTRTTRHTDCKCSSAR